MIIDQNFRIEISADNVVLHYEGDPYEQIIPANPEKDKAEIRRIVTPKDYWYYPSVSIALSRYADKCMQKGLDTCETVLDLVDRLDAIEEYVLEASKKL